MTYAQARAELFNLKGVNEDGSGRRQWGSFSRPGITAGGQVRGKNARPGFYDTAYGIAPTEAEVQAYWRANGGGRGKGRRPAPAAPAQSDFDQVVARNAVAPTAAAAAPSMYEQLLLDAAGDVKSKTAEANKANLDRYLEEKGLKQGVYDRSMGELDNWGGVQSQLNAETAQRNLDQINADLADRGLANSTNTIAAKLHSDRNLGLIQQDLSEKKSDRKVQYDRTLTGDIGDVVRSRFDNAPDPNALMDIYAKLGAAQASQQARQQAMQDSRQSRADRLSENAANRSLAERIAALSAGGQRRGRNGMQAAMMANNIAARFVGGIAGTPNPGAVAGSMVAGNIPSMTPSWYSNAFPTRRGESRDESLYRRLYG